MLMVAGLSTALDRAVLVRSAPAANTMLLDQPSSPLTDAVRRLATRIAQLASVLSREPKLRPLQQVARQPTAVETIRTPHLKKRWLHSSSKCAMRSNDLFATQ